MAFSSAASAPMRDLEPPLAGPEDFWLCVLNIVGNGITQAISDKQYGLAFFEAAGFPLTYLLYPFLQPDAGNARPWADGHTLIPVLIAGVLAYPISTIIGGLEPVDR